MNEDDRPPICPRCGVTMVPAALSAATVHNADWVCLECEELDVDWVHRRVAEDPGWNAS